ncbi:ATP-binding protein [Micromonospora sp. NPDC047812]|uniref:ATP-binding protein n=1 Tax=Micromonospora sp. NPDC047812 TaxID=3155742 RepID=UPI00345240AD
MRISLPGRAYLADLERFLRLLEDDDKEEFTLVLREGLFSLHPVVLAMIAATGAAADSAGQSTQVKNLTVNSSTRYLRRMNVFSHINTEVDISVREHEAAGRFIPVRNILTNEELNDFIKDFVPLLHMEPRDADAVKYVLFELIRNVLEHSGSSTGAFVAAQVSQMNRRLLLGVADAGIGINRSISRSHRANSDREAISLALRPGITGASPRFGGNETNGGAGLFFLKSMATLSRHHMVVVSGDCMMKLLTQRNPQINADIANDRVTWFGIPNASYRGTAVGIDLQIDSPVGFVELLRQIGQVYHIDVKKQKAARFKPRFS